MATLLTQEGYRLQANRKTRDGAQPPDRDAQFHYLSQCTKQFLARRAPVLSVDTKKKELGGNCKNPGQRGPRAGGHLAHERQQALRAPCIVQLRPPQSLPIHSSCSLTSASLSPVLAPAWRGGRFRLNYPQAILPSP